MGTLPAAALPPAAASGGGRAHRREEPQTLRPPHFARLGLGGIPASGAAPDAAGSSQGLRPAPQPGSAARTRRPQAGSPRPAPPESEAAAANLGGAAPDGREGGGSGSGGGDSGGKLRLRGCPSTWGSGARRAPPDSGPPVPPTGNGTGVGEAAPVLRTRRGDRDVHPSPPPQRGFRPGRRSGIGKVSEPALKFLGGSFATALPPRGRPPTGPLQGEGQALA